jgi:general secretion pathway protein B
VAAARTAQATPTPGATAADASVVARDQLPPNIRAALPQLTIGGSMYSSIPANRSLIVNGQLFRERDRLTSDLALEEIKLKAAVFSFRGHRFEVMY